MGQHKTNPVAQAAARGELSKADRKPRAKTPTHTETLIVPGAKYVEVNCVRVRAVREPITNAFIRRTVQVYGTRLQRKWAKVRGKANVKRAKKARQLLAQLKLQRPSMPKAS